MPSPSTQGGQPVFPMTGSHGKDSVPRAMHPQDQAYNIFPPFDPTSASFPPLSSEWVHFSQSSGSFSDSSSMPSLTPTESSLGSCDYKAGMSANTMHSHMGWPGVGATDMIANNGTQPLTDVGNLFGSQSGFQPASNPFFFCGDFPFPSQPGLLPNTMDGAYPQVQPSLEQKKLLYRTQQFNSAMMLQRYWGGELPPQLKQSCPDEERYLFNLCWEHRFREEDYMWGLVENEFHTIFNKMYTRDELREKLVRCRAKYIEWLPKDREILREAWMRIEKNRYESLLEHFYALGGSRNMMLSASDIQYKVVNEMRLEDGLYVEEKRKRKATRRVGCQKCTSCAETQEGSTIIWCDRYAGTAYN